MTLTRRNALLALAAIPFAPAVARAATGEAWTPFSHEHVNALAEALAHGRYNERPRLSSAGLDYDAYRRIAFRHDRALWSGEALPFRADYLPCGYIYPTPVQLFEVAGGQARPVRFSLDDYHVPAGTDRQAFGPGGISGLRIQHPLNRPDHYDEIAVFQGASYFRSLGRGQGYGVSARGVSIGTGRLNEEFPDFRAFWIERPAANSDRTVVHALLDGPSIAGAYRFEILPGDNTVFDVTATLYPRRDIADGGLGAQSSMFLFGAADRGKLEDFRGAVHDSDGLEVLQADGRRVWRPLTNPARLTMTAHAADSVRGFGLMQRLTAFEAFGDLEARYDRRPSLWVEPVGDWGAGSVHLLELPTGNEYADNVAAFWRPAAPWKRGEAVQVRYRLHWGVQPSPGPLARVARTRRGGRRFAVDFENAPALPARVEAFASAGRVADVTLVPHATPGHVRASFRFEPPPGSADIELRLAGDGGELSETWRFRWTA